MSTLDDLSAEHRRRLRWWALVRPALTAVALVFVYYALPLDAHGGTLPGLVAALAGLAVLLAWQVRAVQTAPSPRLRAVESLATSIPLFVVLFAAFYTTMSGQDESAFTEPLDRTDALYFTVTTLATVGYGDIAAVSHPARIAATVQIVAGLLILGGVVKLFGGAVRIGLRHAGLDEVDEPRAGPAAGGGDHDTHGTRPDQAE
ncbi:potassium channel family protein [Georgenia yuyongxinii]|uniref:Two pore domain potassium channel family protein n=1 Tax=Georgenia yuyongxinii TaxID=2589797 RepID=A0A552WRR5_9MICO|nr:potassium channel family protein [Georgenia yuyongxinii]TRW45434.1 two pore domain potassium channel family protein [Georgenia yuyongxinii]